MIWQNGDYRIDTDKDRLDREVVYRYLAEESYWAKGRPREVQERGIENSLCFGVYHGDEQVGFARAISDQAVFAYLADVFILPAYQGRGLGKWLMACIKAHPDLQGLRWWLLVTNDAHGLYAQFGFGPLSHPERFMEYRNPDVPQP
ncbi:MAG: GNAT family N-acetyltransferase [Anaerolineae bacterium]|nr:GNAT family N-acetyltransferase [Anaerolineae bacterium]